MLAKIPEWLQPITGYLSLGIVILVISAVIFLLRSHAKKKVALRASAEKPKHHDDHPKPSHGHTEGGRGSALLNFGLLIVLLVVAYGIFRFIDHKVGVPGAPREVSRAYAERNGTLPGGMVPVNYARQIVPAPPGPEGSAFIDVPAGHDIIAYPSIESGEYRIRCRDHAGHLSEWLSTGCKEMDFVQFQATGTEPFDVAFEFKPK